MRLKHNLSLFYIACLSAQGDLVLDKLLDSLNV